MAAALCRRGEVLLCHRVPARRWFPDVWDFPGGHVERGEAPRVALAREVHEEVGATVAIERLPGEPDLHVQDGQLDLSVWAVTAWEGEPVNRAPHEHDRIGWFRVDDASRVALAHSSYQALFSLLAGRSDVM